MKPLCTTKEIADLFGVDFKTIQKRCAAGTMFPPPVLTRPYRFSRVQVDRVLSGELRQPSPIYPRPNRRGFFKRAS